MAAVATLATSHAHEAPHTQHAQAHHAAAAWTTYHVRRGDTLADIAGARHTSIAHLVVANHLRGGGRLLRIGQALKVPASEHRAPKPAQHARARREVTHVVRTGDTISDLARRYHVSPGTLLRLNHLDRRGRIYAGQHLKVPASAVRTAARHRAPAAHTKAYRVRTGDTVSGLALRFHVGQAAIRKANHLGRAGFIRAGRVLRIPVPAPHAAFSATTFAGRTYPRATLRAAARHRAELARRRVPSRAATRALIIATARRHGVDPGLALAVAWQESGWDQRQVSIADAIGTMQVVPSTGTWASALAGRHLNLLDTRDNVTAGVVVLRALLNQAHPATAVAGYYQGLGSVRQHGMYADTKAYVRSVLALKARFS